MKLKNILAGIVLSLSLSNVAHAAKKVEISSWLGGWQDASHSTEVNGISLRYEDGDSVYGGAGLYATVHTYVAPVPGKSCDIRMRIKSRKADNTDWDHSTEMEGKFIYQSQIDGNCNFTNVFFPVVADGIYKLDTYYATNAVEGIVWRNHHAVIQITDQQIAIISDSGHHEDVYPNVYNSYAQQYTFTNTYESDRRINGCKVKVVDAADKKKHIVDILGYVGSIYGHGCYFTVPHEYVTDAPSGEVHIDVFVDFAGGDLVERYEWRNWMKLKSNASSQDPVKVRVVSGVGSTNVQVEVDTTWDRTNFDVRSANPIASCRGEVIDLVDGGLIDDIDAVGYAFNCKGDVSNHYVREAILGNVEIRIYTNDITKATAYGATETLKGTFQLETY